MSTLEPEHAIDPTIIKFINHYIETLSASDSGKYSGISTASANRILKKPDVQAALKLINETMGRKSNFDGAELLERTNEIATYDPIDVFNHDGTVKAIKDIPAPIRRAVKKLVVREVWDTDPNGVPVMTGYIKTIEFYDKVKGLEMLGKYDGVFRERVDHTHEIGDNLAHFLLASERMANGRDVTPELKLGKDNYQNAFAIEASKVKIEGDDGD